MPPPPAPPPPPLRVPVEEPVDLRFAPQQAEAGERFHLQPVSNWACLRVVPAGASPPRETKSQRFRAGYPVCSTFFYLAEKADLGKKVVF